VTGIARIVILSTMSDGMAGDVVQGQKWHIEIGVPYRPDAILID
jgi:hypothetical protein